MPTDAEFEEKEYEQPLYEELAVAPGHTWTPGQVLEGAIGIDAAIRAARTYWRLCQRRSEPGVPLPRFGAGAWFRRQHGVPVPDLPDFSANVFLQSKRPAYYVLGPRHNGKTLLVGPAWGFSVSEHQQEILKSLASSLRAQADVAYAAPAFHTRAALNAARQGGTVASESTFPPATWLSGHSRWVYDQAGASGCACSEPEAFRGEAFDIRLAKLVAAREAPSRPTRVDLMRNLRSLLNALRDALAAGDVALVRVLDELLAGELVSADEDVELAVASVRVAADIAGLDWFVAGPAKP